MTTTEIQTAAPEDQQALTVLEQFTPSDARKTQLATQAKPLTEKLLALNPRSPDYGQALVAITAVGREQVEVTSEALDQVLDRGVLPASGQTKASAKATTELGALRDVMVEFDPTGKPKKLGARIKKAIAYAPLMNAMRERLYGPESAKRQLDQIKEIFEGTIALVNDDDMIITDVRRSLWDNLALLGEQGYILEQLDRELEAAIAEIAKTDPQRAQELTATALATTRRRRVDIAIQALVTFNADNRFELHATTGRELAEHMRSAKSTSMNALKLVAASRNIGQAQENAAKIASSLRETTGSMILQSAKDTADTAIRVAELNNSGAIDTTVLAEACQISLAAIDTVERINIEATARMKGELAELETALKASQERKTTAPITLEPAAPRISL